MHYMTLTHAIHTEGTLSFSLEFLWMQSIPTKYQIQLKEPLPDGCTAFFMPNNEILYTLEPLYKMIHYKMVSDIRWFKCGPQKCCILTKMYRLYRKMIIFLYDPYIFVWIQHGCLANMVFALNPNNSVIKRLWCIYYFTDKIKNQVTYKAIF